MNKNSKRLLGTVYDVYRKSNAKNPIKTGNVLADYAIGQNKFTKAWNVGFNAGKAAFVAQQSYKELKQSKKR